MYSARICSGGAPGKVIQMWRIVAGPSTSAIVIVSPCLMMRCGMPLRPLATVPPPPRSPVMFSNVMARLSNTGDTFERLLTSNNGPPCRAIGIQILTESEMLRLAERREQLVRLREQGLVGL